MRSAIDNGIYTHNFYDSVRFLSLEPIQDERFGTVNNWLGPNHLRYTLQHFHVEHSTPDA